MHEYLCTNVILWKRQDAYNKLKQGKVFNHSMEIEITDGSFVDQGYYEIRDFQFTAFCILSNSVEPCFEQSQIELFNKNEFKSQFTEMMKELKESVNFLHNQSSITPDVDIDKTNTQEGGKVIVNEKLELLKKYNLEPESISFSIEELSLEEIENKITEQFALLASQKQEELSNAIRVEKYRDRWGDEYSRFCYVEHTDVEVFAYDKQDNWKLYGFTYSMDGDSIIVDFATKKRKKFDIVDFVDGVSTEFNLFPQEAIEYELSSKEKELKEQFANEKEIAINEVKSQLDTISVEYENIKPEFNRLQDFEKTTLATERKESEEVLFTQFEKLTGLDEFETLKSKSSEFTLEELEEKCFAILGKKNANFSVKTKENKTVKITVDKTDSTDTTPYGGIIEKYLNK
jgi:hypothetical protein